MFDYLSPILYTTCLSGLMYILYKNCVKIRREEEYRRNQSSTNDDVYTNLLGIYKQPSYEDLIQNNKTKQQSPPKYEDINQDKIIINDLDEFNDEERVNTQVSR